MSPPSELIWITNHLGVGQVPLLCHALQIYLLSAVIVKAGIVFDVSVYVYMWVNKPKTGSIDMSYSVDQRISGCECFGKSLFILPSQQSNITKIALQPLQMQTQSWQVCSCLQNAGRVKRGVVWLL